MTLRGSALWAALAIAATMVACTSSASSAPASAASSEVSALATPAGDSGIYGWMVAGRGHPANPPSTECVKVMDSAGANVIARGTCSGPSRQFRVPLAPGNYLVEVGGHWESRAGAVRFVPNRTAVEVKPGQWVKLAPPNPPAPLP